MRIWRDDLYSRVNAHVRRVQVSRARAMHVQEEKEAGSGGRGKRGESLVKKEAPYEASDDYPDIVAFTGKRHFASLFDPPLKKVDSFGPQPAHRFGKLPGRFGKLSGSEFARCKYSLYIFLLLFIM